MCGILLYTYIKSNREGDNMTEASKRPCSICQDPIGVDSDGIWDGGHNAQPVNNGRCCENCNELHVIPARMKEFFLNRSN